MAALPAALPTRQALAAARYWAVGKTPYFAQAILSLVPREVPDGTLGQEQGTFAVTAQGIMLYEPSALARWTTQEAGSVIIHEVMHWLRDHAGRRKAISADPTLYNIAGDLEINDDLVLMKLPLPDGGGLHPQDFQLAINRTAEEYYHALVQQQAAQQKRQPPHGGKGGSSGEDAPQGAQGDKGGGKGDPGRNPRCGGCAGNPGKSEPEDDPQGRTEAAVVVLKQSTALAIKAHAQQHGIGSVPAGMVRWAEKLTTPPKVMWQQKLATLGRSAVARRAGATDHTFNRVSRRQAGYGFGVGKMIAPALVSRQPNVVIALDTSGSMGKSEVDRAVTEADAIMRSIGGAVHLIACDCRVHATLKVNSIRELLGQIKGGGGTDFRPVFEELANVRPAPDVLIFITDGGGWAPERPPGKTRVIWLLVGKHRMKPMLASNGAGYTSVGYGDFIEVDE